MTSTPGRGEKIPESDEVSSLDHFFSSLFLGDGMSQGGVIVTVKRLPDMVSHFKSSDEVFLKKYFNGLLAYRNLCPVHTHSHDNAPKNLNFGGSSSGSRRGQSGWTGLGHVFGAY